MDEPTAALPEADVLRLFAHRAQPARPRRRRGLHQPPHGRDLRARRPGHRAARRRAMSPPRPVAETSEPELITMMVGRVIDHLFPKFDADDRRSRCSRCATWSRRRCARRQPRRARRRDRGPRRADRLRPQRGGADRLRHDAGALGRDPHRRPAGPDRQCRRGQAARHRLRARGPRQPGRDPADDPGRERVPGRAAPHRPRPASSTAREEETLATDASPASPSGRAGRSRSSASCRAATSRRSCSASGWRPGRAC